MKELISNNFNININKEVVAPPLVSKEIISNSFTININKQLVIQNNPPSVTNIKVLNTNVLGNFELQFDLIDIDDDKMDVFLKIGSNDYKTILTNQESGTINYKGINMPSGTNICNLKITDGKSITFSKEFEIVIPQVVNDDIFESIELLTDKNLKGGEYSRVAIRLKTKANISNKKINPKLSLPQGSVLKNIQWEKGTIMTDYRQSVSEISSKTSDLLVDLKGIKGTVENIEGSYVTKSEMSLNSQQLEVKFSESGGYNLLYNGDFKNKLEHWSQDITNGFGWSDGLSCKNGRGVYSNGELNVTKAIRQQWVKLDPNLSSYTLSFWQYTTSDGQDGTTNPYRTIEVAIGYEDGTVSWHSVGVQTNYNVWEKKVIKIPKPNDKKFGHANVGLWVRDTTKTVYYSQIMLEKGSIASEWSPNPNEVHDGIVTLDNNGIKVTSSNSNTHTVMDSSSFRVENNQGGTVAEFSNNSTIPNLTAGIINSNEVYAGNICSKSPKSGDIKFIYVNGSTGNDNNNGTQSSPYKTVQRAISDINDKQDQSVTIYVYNSVPSFELKGITGTGIITISLQDSAIVNGYVIIGGVTNAVKITNETGSLKATLKNGISIYRCTNVDIYGVTFRGTNAQGNNILVQDTNYCAVNSCDLGGLSTQLGCAIQVRASLLWLHGCRGSNITDVVGQYAFSHVMMARAGTSNVPDYSNGLLVNYDGSGRIQNWTGGTFTKTPSSGWNPSYTPTARTSTWSFNKIWSDETKNGWSNRQELIQGYSSAYDTGRWTGYLQMTDGMTGIKNTISGSTNLSGRVYVQRKTSSGASTGTCCMYASDGTHIANISMARGAGAWFTLSSAVVSKIMNGTITYFYLKNDADNINTYMKMETLGKIEITYTK